MSIFDVPQDVWAEICTSPLLARAVAVTCGQLRDTLQGLFLLETAETADADIVYTLTGRHYRGIITYGLDVAFMGKFVCGMRECQNIRVCNGRYWYNSNNDPISSYLRMSDAFGYIHDDAGNVWLVPALQIPTMVELAAVTGIAGFYGIVGTYIGYGSNDVKKVAHEPDGGTILIVVDGSRVRLVRTCLQLHEIRGKVIVCREIVPLGAFCR